MMLEEVRSSIGNLFSELASLLPSWGGTSYGSASDTEYSRQDAGSSTRFVDLSFHSDAKKPNASEVDDVHACIVPRLVYVGWTWAMPYKTMMLQQMLAAHRIVRIARPARDSWPLEKGRRVACWVWSH